MLELKNVYKEYNTGKTSIKALRGVSCKIPSGKSISVVGKSGCGKSTLLNIIGGLDRPGQGSVLYNNREINKFKSSNLAKYRKSIIGMIFQSFNLIPSLTAWENIAIALAIGDIPRKNRKEIAVRLLNEVGLGDRISHLPSELSGGESQRVAIARALANNPDIILADEPTGNLDTETSLKIMELLRNLNQKHNKTLIMVTHDLDYANRYSDIILTMKDGIITDNINLSSSNPD